MVDLCFFRVFFGNLGRRWEGEAVGCGEGGDMSVNGVILSVASFEVGQVWEHFGRTPG